PRKDGFSACRTRSPNRAGRGAPSRVPGRHNAATQIDPAPQVASKMILADTSVWMQFFRAGDSELETLLEEGRIAMHDFVLGELACGNLRDRSRTIADLRLLPR